MTPALFAVYLDLFFRPQLYRAVNGYHRRINAASRTGLALGMKGWVSVLLFVVLKKKTATRRSYFFDGLEKCQIGDCARRARHGPRLIYRCNRPKGLRTIDATAFRVGDLFAWHPFRIHLTSFKSGVNRRLIRRTGA